MSVKLAGAVRTLNANDLGVGYSQSDPATHASSAPDAPAIDPTDPQVLNVISLLHSHSGVILSGPPGTSKSYLAAEVAAVLSHGEEMRVAFTQFHASYQYEDFMEGYRPDEATGGFTHRFGVFLALCEEAAKPSNSEHEFVIVIDELSRGDAARVFGESLTYIEKSKRGRPFQLPSGRAVRIPPNVHVIATMNPLDRGVDEVDGAFERRFAKLMMLPDRELLAKRLAENAVSEALSTSLLGFFDQINGMARNFPQVALGHAYFWDVTDGASAQSAWDYQIQHHVDRAFQYDPETRESLRNAWLKVADDEILPEPDASEDDGEVQTGDGDSPIEDQA